MQRARRDSVLATVLFTDIVGSSNVAGELGDRRWRVLLSQHHEVVRRALKRHGGRELDTAGDGFFATFESQANAIRCAAAVVGAVQALGIDVRAGLHVGEAEIVGRKLGGTAVHIGARVMALAGPAEVIVTSVLKDLVPGSGFVFEDRGTHSLKGVEGAFHLYRVVSVGTPLPGPLDPAVAAARRAAIEPPPLWRRRSMPLVGPGLAIAVAAGLALIAFRALSPAPVRAPRSVAAPAHALLEIDPATGRVLERIAIGHPSHRDPNGPGPEPHGIAVGEDAVWVTDQGDDHVLRIDPTRVRITATVAVGSPNGIAVGTGAVWVAQDSGKVAVIDPATDVATEIALPTGASEPLDVSVDPASGTAFVTSLGCFGCNPGSDLIFGRVFILDRTSGTRGVISLKPNPVVGTAIVAGGALWVDAGSDLWRVDLGTREVRSRIAIGGFLGRVVGSPDGGSLWLAVGSLGGQGGELVRIEASTRRVTDRLPLGCCPGALAVGADGVAWITNSAQGTVTRVDPVTLATTVFPVGAGADGVAVGYGHVWVTVDRPGVL